MKSHSWESLPLGLFTFKKPWFKSVSYDKLLRTLVVGPVWEHDGSGNVRGISLISNEIKIYGWINSKNLDAIIEPANFTSPLDDKIYNFSSNI